jgi:hypothetical protein
MQTPAIAFNRILTGTRAAGSSWRLVLSGLALAALVSGCGQGAALREPAGK